MNETDRRIQTAINQAVHYRNYRRIRDRALRRLANNYPDEYKILLEEERARDAAEGKAWLDITGRTSVTEGNSGSPNRGGQISKLHTNADTEDEGDLGGEG